MVDLGDTVASELSLPFDPVKYFAALENQDNDTSPIVDYVLQRSNLCQHYERMTQHFFADSVSSAVERELCEALIAR